jgi:hypothetical protein
MPSLFYNVYGRQIDARETLEFRGGYSPSNGKEATLICQVRTAPTVPNLPAVAAAAKPAATAAARVDNEDDDEEDADDAVDYDELIALHEDAGLSVDDLQKRYRGKDDNTSASPSKKGKPAPKDYDEDDDDDDDDYGF